MKWTILVCGVLLASGCKSVPLKTWTAPVSYNLYLQDQGGFVECPTVVGDVVGIPASLIVLPLLPFLGTGSPDPETGLPDPITCETVILSRLMFGPSLVGDVVGTPFLVVRRILWDFPKRCVTGCGSLASRSETLSGTLTDIPDTGSSPVPLEANHYFIGNTRVQPTRTVPETSLAKLVGQDVTVTGKIVGEKIVARGIEVEHK